MESEANFVWLIEAPGQYYLATRRIAHSSEFVWLKDPHRAVRFMTREQADEVHYALKDLHPELFAYARVLGDARSTEHGFIGNGENEG